MIFFNPASTDNYVQFNLSGSVHLILSNDSGLNSISVSLNGSKEELRLLPDETIEFKDFNQAVIYVKSYSPGNSANFRVIGWGEAKVIYPPEQAKQSMKSVLIPKRVQSIDR